jgi:hypothetical protein
MSFISAFRRPGPAMPVTASATGVLLAGTAVLILALHRGDYARVAPACMAVCASAVTAGLLEAALTMRRRALAAARRAPAAVARLAAQLSPVIFLSLAYPFAAGRLAGVRVGGLPFHDLLLATSITAPWLSQIVCMPLFSVLSSSPDEGGQQLLRARALEAWPVAFCAAIPVVAAGVIPVWLTERWSISAALVYGTLCLLNAAFAQSLVYAIVSRNPRLWVLGWAVYAAVLFTVPWLWFLPPVAGLLVQSLYLGWRTRKLPLRPQWPAGLLVGLGQGALIGCILWSDKYLYFLRFPDRYDAALLFGAMLPAIVAYNFYFALLAPRTDGLVDSVRRAMADAPVATLRQECTALSGHIRGSAGRAAFLCAALSAGTVAYLCRDDPGRAWPAGCEMLACWCFVMGTLACYKLAYLGRGRLAYGYGALHLAITACAFSLGPTGPDVYLALAGTEVVLVTLMLRSCLRGWDRPEFMLFWRHAVKW